MQLRRQVGIGVAGRAGTMVVAFVGSVVLARTIGDSGYGQFYFLLAVVSVVDNPFTGWMSACRKRMTEESFSRPEGVGAVLLMIVTSSLIVGVISILIDPFIPQETVYVAVLFTGSISFIGATKVVKSTDEYSRSYFLDMIRDILRVGLQILFVYIIGDIFGMVFGMFTANILIASVLFRFNISLPSQKTLRSIFTYAKSSSVEGLIGTVLSKMDILLLGWLTTDAVVGNYQVALNLSMPALALASVIGAGVLNKVSYDDSINEDSSVTIQHAINYASLLAFPILAGAIVFGEIVVVTIYSSQYQVAGTFIVGLSAYRLFHTQNSILTSVINGVDRPDLNLKISVFVLIINLALGLILFISYGPVGFIIATVVGSFLRFALSYQFVKHKYSISITSDQIIVQVFASAVMAVVVFSLEKMLDLNVPLIILLLGTAGGVYFLILYLLSDGFRGLLNESIRSIA